MRLRAKKLTVGADNFSAGSGFAIAAFFYSQYDLTAAVTIFDLVTGIRSV
jgi:hypothetical protein